MLSKPSLTTNKNQSSSPLKNNPNKNVLPKNQKYYDYNSTVVSQKIIKSLLSTEKNERCLYLLHHGIIRRYEEKEDLLYVEIPQHPKTLIVYRKANLNQNKEKIFLNNKDSTHIPLIETEDNTKILCLSLENNLITKIENLEILNNLLFLTLYNNKISEIENFNIVPKLKVLFLGKNYISKIKNLDCLSDLEVLDLHANKISIIENLENLTKLRIINLANNNIKTFDSLTLNKNLEDINLNKNYIKSIPNLSLSFDKLKKINLRNNLISNVDALLEFKNLIKIEEINIEYNPIFYNKDSCEKISKLHLKLTTDFNSLFHQNNINKLNNKNEVNSSVNIKNNVTKENKSSPEKNNKINIINLSDNLFNDSSNKINSNF